MKKHIVLYISKELFTDVLFFKQIKKNISFLSSRSKCVVVIASDDKDPDYYVESVKQICSKLQDELIPVLPIALYYLSSTNHDNDLLKISFKSIKKFFMSNAIPFVSCVSKKKERKIVLDSSIVADAIAKTIQAEHSLIINYSPPNSKKYFNLNKPNSDFLSFKINEFEEYLSKNLS